MTGAGQSRTAQLHQISIFSEQELHRTEVPSPPVDQHGLCAPQGAPAELARVEANASNPLTDEPRIVFATGYDAMTGPLLSMDIRGQDGFKLAQAWEVGPRNYLGLQVAGFPNLFINTGPGSPSVLCNMPVAIEQRCEWITDCIAHMLANGIERIEAKPEAMDGWVEKVNEAAKKTLLPLAKHSWYGRQHFRQAPGLHARHGLLSRDLCGRRRQGL